MTIEIAGHVLERKTSDTSSERSDMFGRMLRRGALEFAAPTSDEDRINDRLNSARDAEPLVDSDATMWRVDSWSTQYRDDARWIGWAVSLVESLSLDISSIEVLGLNWIPRWLDVDDRSSADDGVSVVTAEFVIDSESHDSFFALGDSDPVPNYFPVFFHGVATEPISMRFGKMVWARSDDEFVYHVTFVTEQGDTEERGGLSNLNQPQLNRTTEMAAKADRMIVSLISHLRDAGVLTPEMVGSIHAQAGTETSREQNQELSRTNDIEEFRT